MLNPDIALKPLTEWRISDRPITYPEAVAEMENRAAAIAQGGARELVWLRSIPPSIRRALRLTTPIRWTRAFPFFAPAAAANSLITGRVSAWAM